MAAAELLKVAGVSDAAGFSQRPVGGLHGLDRRRRTKQSAPSGWRAYPARSSLLRRSAPLLPAGWNTSNAALVAGWFEDRFS